MSYILDALRKSETERRQGRVPDLGQQVQLIHKPRKKSVPVLFWVAVGLILNAAVLAWVFWPLGSPSQASEPETTSAAPGAREAAPTPAVVPEPGPERAVQGSNIPLVKPPQPGRTLENAVEIPVPGASPEPLPDAIAASGSADVRERPTVIIPTPRTPSAVNRSANDDSAGERTPHLVELPLSFQKKVPDLIFNSHIYASEPSSRRVMINDNYLRPGESFSGITVERITEEGVELSMDGRRFRVGVVRDWVGPE